MTIMSSIFIFIVLLCFLSIVDCRFLYSLSVISSGTACVPDFSPIPILYLRPSLRTLILPLVLLSYVSSLVARIFIRVVTCVYSSLCCWSFLSDPLIEDCLSRLPSVTSVILPVLSYVIGDCFYVRHRRISCDIFV